jgi:hypothetical protein
MILFYSSRIVGSLAGQVSNLEDSLYCLQTIRHLDVYLAYFNIEAIECTQEDINLIQLTLSKFSFDYKLSWTRPVTLDCWREHAQNLVRAHTDENIIFIFNHDHAFISPFAENLVNDASRFIEKGEHRIFYFNHVEENFVSTIFPPIGFYYCCDDNFYINTGYLNWIDGYFICKGLTFKKLFDSVIDAPAYMPRIDWPGVILKSEYYELGFTLEPYAVHLDGYDHFINPSVINFRELIKNNNYSSMIIETKLKLLYSFYDHIFKSLRLPKFTHKVFWSLVRCRGLRKLKKSVQENSYKTFVHPVDYYLKTSYTVETMTISRLVYSFAPKSFKTVRDFLKKHDKLPK